MKALKYLTVLVLIGVLGVGSVWAGGRARIGVGMYFGAPVGPWYGYPSPFYYPPYYYPPQVVVVPAAPPPVYIEQNGALPPPPTTPANNYWYFCEAPQAYYPYVKECPEGWLRVAPQTVPPDLRR